MTVNIKRDILHGFEKNCNMIKKIISRVKKPRTEPEATQLKIGKPIEVNKKMRFCPICGQMHDRSVYVGCVSRLPIK